MYLDASSTAKYGDVDDIIVNAMKEAMEEYWMNPSSLYASDVKNKINRCRNKISEYIGAKPEEIYFTSGASESNNWVLRGFADESWRHLYDNPYIITTTIEHKSIMEAVKNESLGAIVRYCEVDKYGMVDLDHLEELLKQCDDNPVLVSVCMANNEIGVVQHIKIISHLVHSFNGVLHVDATQALTHIPIDVENLGIDLLSASGHKISTVLKGVGFLYKRNGVDIQPLIYGSQESGLRGGTENTFGIVGLSKALDYHSINYEKIGEMIDKRNYFINLLETRFGCKLNGHYEYRLPNNINVTFPHNITGEALLWTLDLSDMQISTGSACNSHSIEPSHVLKAIGLSDKDAMKTIRISLSEDITYEDISNVVSEIDKAISIISA